jgi:hypothetical protein
MIKPSDEEMQSPLRAWLVQLRSERLKFKVGARTHNHAAAWWQAPDGGKPITARSIIGEQKQMRATIARPWTEKTGMH